MNMEHIKRLVSKSVEAANPWQIPVLGELVDQYFEHISTRLNYYKLLYYLVQEMQPAVCVELGVEYGLGSAHMAAAAHKYGGWVIGVDRNNHQVPAEIIPEAWPMTYTYMLGDTVDVADLVSYLIEDHGGIGVLFQDSSHHYAPSCQEWDAYRPMMADGGVWICDDITPSFFEPGVDEKSMVAYFNERPAKEKERFPDVLHYGNVVGVMVL